MDILTQTSMFKLSKTITSMNYENMKIFRYQICIPCKISMYRQIYGNMEIITKPESKVEIKNNKIDHLGLLVIDF